MSLVPYRLSEPGVPHCLAASTGRGEGGGHKSTGIGALTLTPEIYKTTGSSVAWGI